MNHWKVWNKEAQYGRMLFLRAVGKLPEMESSKSVAKILAKYLQKGSTLADVGCGAGHYLRTFRKKFGDSFFYTGIDATAKYITFARKAFRRDKQASFIQGDIYHLRAKTSSFDVVICNNLFLHLPEIQKPISELVRIAKKTVIIRLLAGNRSFKIQAVKSKPGRMDFNRLGEPREFHFMNIFSHSFLEALLKTNKKVKRYKIFPDTNFSAEKIRNSKKDNPKAFNPTEFHQGYQINGYIIQPWSIITIEL